MNIHRRVFFSLLFTRPIQTDSIRVAVIEVFNIGQAASAVLVHHSSPPTRDLIARWLRAHPKATIVVRNKSGDDTPATIFRVRMCFGRGLILFERPIPVHERDVLTVAARNA